MKKTALFFLAVLLLVSTLTADIYIKTRINVDPINAMGQSLPAKETFSEQWISNDLTVISGQGLSYLFDLKKNKIYLISQATKSYLEITPPLDFASLLPPELGPMAEAWQQMTMTVTPKNETKVINNIPCQGYRLEMTVMMYPVEMTIWASDRLPYDLGDYLLRVQPEIIKMELRASAQTTAEIQKIKGLWIAYEMKAQMMGTEIKSRAEVVEISKKPAPPGVYSIPAGYQKKDRLSREDIQGF
ncbi:MAG: hypothetical protein KBC18_05465 [Candidatus Saccharicenans sp.]|nr:hypothetical protein [Candidatus Saccharicenans sp.]